MFRIKKSRKIFFSFSGGMEFSRNFKNKLQTLFLGYLFLKIIVFKKLVFHWIRNKTLIWGMDLWKFFQYFYFSDFKQSSLKSVISFSPTWYGNPWAEKRPFAGKYFKIFIIFQGWFWLFLEHVAIWMSLIKEQYQKNIGFECIHVIKFT